MRHRWSSGWPGAAVVTGGSKGIGKAIAAELVAEGVAVTIRVYDPTPQVLDGSWSPLVIRAIS